MWIYLFKSVFCLLALFGFYKLMLENESCHNFKRFYLLAASIFSLILPTITFTYKVERPEVTHSSVEFIEAIQVMETRVSFWEEYGIIILAILYIIGFLFFAFRFLRNIISLYKDAVMNEKLEEFKYIFVLLRKKLVPYSFLNYIFLNKSEFEKNNISSAVVEHEKAHVDQKHSLDLIFIELLQVFFWFNPVFYFIKRSMKLNHEFLADSQVLAGNINAFDYSNILYDYSSGMHENALASSISHSLIKKRIIMITKQFSVRRFTLRLLIFLPVLAGCIFLFNEEIKAETLAAPVQNQPSIIEKQEKKTISVRVEGEIIFLNNKQVTLDNFAEKLDKVTSDWTSEEMEKPWFEINFQNSNTEFIERLNKEYRKTKLSEVSGTEFLAPKPPAAPAAGTPPPPPPPPVQKRENNIPPPPPPAPERGVNESVRAEREGVRNQIREERLAHRKQLMEDREQMIAEREEMKALREKYRQEDLTEERRKEIEQQIKARRAAIVDRKREIEKRQIEIEKSQEEIKREHLRMAEKARQMQEHNVEPPTPPKPPSPLEMIEKIDSQGGSFFYNDKKINADQAKEIIKKNKDLQIRITDNDNDEAKFMISDN